MELQLGSELGHGGGEAVVPDVLTQTAQEEQECRQEAAEAEAAAAATAAAALQRQREKQEVGELLTSLGNMLGLNSCLQAGCDQIPLLV